MAVSWWYLGYDVAASWWCRGCSMVVLCCDYEDVWMYKMANFCFLTSAMKCLRGEGRGGGWRRLQGGEG